MPQTPAEIFDAAVRRIERHRGCSTTDAAFWVRNTEPELWAAVENSRQDTAKREAEFTALVNTAETKLGMTYQVAWSHATELFPEVYAAAFLGQAMANDEAGLPTHIREMRNALRPAKSSTPTPATRASVSNDKPAHREEPRTDNRAAYLQVFLGLVRKAELEMGFSYNDATNYCKTAYPKEFSAATGGNNPALTELDNAQQINLPPGVKRMADGGVMVTGPADREELVKLGLPLEGTPDKVVSLYRSFFNMEPSPELIRVMMVTLIQWQRQTSIDFDGALAKAAIFIRKVFPDMKSDLSSLL